MKRGTPQHYKMHALATDLKCPLYAAVGIMEMLWHYAGQNTPRGDIGVMPDRAIALAVGWMNKAPDVLINALVCAGWLDLSEEHRLLIHDWPDHCEYEVRRSLIRKNKDWVPVYGRSVYDKCAEIPGIGAPMARNSPASREALGKGSVSEVKPTSIEKPSPRARTPDPREAWFEEWWKTYWRKKARSAAHTAYFAAVKSEFMRDKVLAAVAEQTAEMMAKEPHLRPHASTWLHQERWNDEPEEPQLAAAGHPRPRPIDFI